MNPEERAKALVEECRAYDGEGDLVFIACDRAESLIAKAITEAEDEALEDAAAAAAGEALRCLESGYDRAECAVGVVIAVRNLKSKQGT